MAPAALRPGPQDSPALDPWTVRQQFPGANNGIYLDTSAHALLPVGARAAVARYVDDCIDAGGRSATMTDPIARVRAKFAALIGAHSDEIAIVRSVSEGINAVVASLPWRAGDNVIVCPAMEHPNGLYALYNMRKRHGIEVRTCPPNASLGFPADAVPGFMDRNTRLVIASTVAFASGARTDIDALARICRERNVLLLLDGAQSIGALDFDVRHTAADALAVGASKYLCGPSGFGFLYVRRAVAERIAPVWLAWRGVDLGDAHPGEAGGEDYQLMPAARRFEVGSYNYAGANATEVSLDLIAGAPVAAIEQHVLGLARNLTGGLARLGVPLISGAHDQHCSHIVVAGRAHPDTACASLLKGLHDQLAAGGVKLASRHGRLRFSLHFYNTPDEIERVLALAREALDRHKARAGG